jgi:hypothetical protein
MTNEARQRLAPSTPAARSAATRTGSTSRRTYATTCCATRSIAASASSAKRSTAQASDPELAGQIRELRRIVGLRNRVVHGYDTIDWTVRETASANLRRLVRRVLRRHGYPPDQQEAATDLVLEQAELLAPAWAA